MREFEADRDVRYYTDSVQLMDWRYRLIERKNRVSKLAATSGQSRECNAGEVVVYYD
jgi:hypothetical protein